MGFCLLAAGNSHGVYYVCLLYYAPEVPNHQRWHGKMEAQLESIHTAYTFPHIRHRFCMLSRCSLAKISASELSRKLIKSVLLVGNHLRKKKPLYLEAPHIPRTVLYPSTVQVVQ